MKKGFTLVELLIVVAILGILAAVGIVSFGGFLGSAKVNATKTMHKNVVSFMSSSILHCSFTDTIKLVYEDGEQYNYNCNGSGNTYPLRDAYIVHFRGSKFVNPYDGSQNIDNYGSDGLGRIAINNWSENGVTGFVISTLYKDGESVLKDILILE